LIKSFTDLIAWQEGHKLLLYIYKLTKNFPDDEKFGLTSQIKRSAVSISSNIAEGFGRNSRKDKLQFYAISKGSLYEAESQLRIALDLNYVTAIEFNTSKQMFDKNSRLISGLIKSAADRL
jgi:four helix bundle protein